MHRRQLSLRLQRQARAAARALARCLLVGLLLAPATALAQAPETDGQRLFREGREALDRGEVDVACARFEESHRLEAALGPLLNLANCNEKRGRTARALEDWRRAASLARPDQSDQRQLARERVAELERRVPRLTLRRGTLAPADMTVLLDDAPAAVDGAARPVDPGVHRIVISAAGRTTTTREIRMVEGQVLELTLEPGPAPLAETGEGPAGTETAADAGPSPLLVGGLVASGVGTLGLAVFAVTGVLALGASSDLEEACGADHRCPAGDSAGRDAAARGEALLVPNAIALGVGAVGLGIGATLLVLHAVSSEDASSALDPAPAGRPSTVLVRF